MLDPKQEKTDYLNQKINSPPLRVFLRVHKMNKLTK